MTYRTSSGVSRRAVAGGVVLVLAATGCHADRPPRSVSEVAATSPIGNDPAARGTWTVALQLPDGAAPEPDGDHDFPDYRSVATEQFDLGAAAARDVPVALSGASLVVAQAIAFGKAAPLELAIRKHGVAAAMASAVALPPDRTQAAVAAELDGTGAVTIHVANATQDRVSVRLVVEVAPRGGH
jgi:hypothetical protein